MDDIEELLTEHFAAESSRLRMGGPDPMPAVTRRAARLRRYRVVTASGSALLAAVVAVVAVVVVHSGSTGPGPVGSPRPSPTPRSASPSTSPSSTPSQPSLTIAVAGTDLGAHRASLDVIVSGLVPQMWDPQSDRPLPAGDTKLLISTVDWGDGTGHDASGAGYGTCRVDAPLVPLTQSLQYQHEYGHAGTYTVTFTTAYCAVDDSSPVSVTKRLDLQVLDPLAGVPAAALITPADLPTTIRGGAMAWRKVPYDGPGYCLAGQLAAPGPFVSAVSFSATLPSGGTVTYRETVLTYGALESQAGLTALDARLDTCRSGQPAPPATKLHFATDGIAIRSLLWHRSAGWLDEYVGLATSGRFAVVLSMSLFEPHPGDLNAAIVQPTLPILARIAAL